jgi:hypothetical protein
MRRKHRQQPLEAKPKGKRESGVPSGIILIVAAGTERKERNRERPLGLRQGSQVLRSKTIEISKKPQNTTIETKHERLLPGPQEQPEKERGAAGCRPQRREINLGTQRIMMAYIQLVQIILFIHLSS